MTNHNFEAELPDGTPVRVYYEYEPGCPATLYPNELAHPEGPESVEIYGVYPIRGDGSEMTCCHPSLSKEEGEYIAWKVWEHQHELQEFSQSKRDAMEEDSHEQ